MVIVSTLGFVSCGGGGGGGATTGVKGFITDMNDAPLKDVVVYNGTTEVKTDASGAYSLPIDAGEKSVSAALANYVLTTKVVTIVDGACTQQDMKLIKVSTTATFDAGDGKTVKDAGAEVKFPKDAYKNADGTKYSGKVTVGVTYNTISTKKGAEAFPGNLLGQETGGDTKVLQSFGFIAVDLKGADGKDLDLDGKATIKYPWNPADGAKVTGDTIPLWHFDIDKGIWIEEGTATYDATSGMFIGEVSHFSTWNLDAKTAGGTIKGCTQDENGAVLTKAIVYVRTAGWTKSIVNDDPTGCFTLINAPSGTNIAVQAMYGTKMSNEKNGTLTSGATWNLGILKLDKSSTAQIVEVVGRLLDTNASSVHYGVVAPIPDPGNNDECFTNEQGYFDCVFIREDRTMINIIGATKGNDNFDINKTFLSNKSLTDFGTIIVN